MSKGPAMPTVGSKWQHIATPRPDSAEPWTVQGVWNVAPSAGAENGLTDQMQEKRVSIARGSYARWVPLDEFTKNWRKAT